MATHTMFGYSSQTLTYNGGKFTLDPDYDWRDDRVRFEISDDDRYFDGDRSNNEVGEDSNQVAKVYDGDGNVLASGRIYVEQYGEIQAPDGTIITIHRMEIGGVKYGYMPSQPLEPGVEYKYIGGGDIDDGDKEDGRPDTRMRYSKYKDVPCFCPGTLIDCVDGQIPVEWLSSGEMILTRDNGAQAVLWVGRTRIDATARRDNPQLHPVALQPGSLGDGCPVELLRVSPQHRVVLQGADISLNFGFSETFCAAKHLTHWPGVTIPDAPGDITYYHVVFADHQIIRANGAWCESFLLCPQSRALLGDADKAHLSRHVSPDFSHAQTALPCLRAWEARILPAPPREHATRIMRVA